MKRLFAIALLLAGAAVRAQNAPTVTAHIEPDSIMIEIGRASCRERV